MIEFKGEMSKEGRRLIKQIQTFPALFLMPLVTLIVAMPIIEVILFGTFLNPKRLPTMAISFAVTTLLLFILFLLISIKDYIPLRIEIIPEKSIRSECRKKTHIYSVRDVRKVIDYGDFYSIRVYQQFEHGLFLCQKDLLTQGSIEKFEKIFENKIVRKGKGKNYEN